MPKEKQYYRFKLPRGSTYYVDETEMVTEKDYYTTIRGDNKEMRDVFHLAHKNFAQQFSKITNSPAFLIVFYTQDFVVTLLEKEGKETL